MSAYEELVDRCNYIAIQYDANPSTVSAFILAEVLRTLETVTPEMREAAIKAPASFDQYASDWLTVLRASPITPP